jgi:pimeloyl-ACP methyl ester carboxylesterase
MSIDIVSTPRGPVAIEVTGRGPALLLLHANPGDRRDWEAVVPDLARDHRVIAVDWPGHGASPAPAPPSAASAMFYAEVLADLASALDLGGATVVGNSVGGYAAARLALEQPRRVVALVLVSPGGFTSHNPVSRAFCRVQGHPWVRRRVAGAMARWYLRGRTATTAAMIDRAGDRARAEATVQVEAAIWRSSTHPDHDLRRRVGAIAQPTLLVWGRRDPIVRIDRDGRAARSAMPAAAFVALDTGHAPYAEDPAAFLGALRPFLATRRAPRTRA